MSFLKPETTQIPAPKLPEAAPPVLAPTGSKPGAKSQRTTFLGSDTAPQNAGGGGMKTLLGS